MTRKLNPRVCRACGGIFRPKTALQRYGNASCKKFAARSGRLLGLYRSVAVPGAKVDH